MPPTTVCRKPAAESFCTADETASRYDSHSQHIGDAEKDGRKQIRRESGMTPKPKTTHSPTKTRRTHLTRRNHETKPNYEDALGRDGDDHHVADGYEIERPTV